MQVYFYLISWEKLTASPKFITIVIRKNTKYTFRVISLAVTICFSTKHKSELESFINITHSNITFIFRIVSLPDTEILDADNVWLQSFINVTNLIINHRHYKITFIAIIFCNSKQRFLIPESTVNCHWNAKCRYIIAALSLT